MADMRSRMAALRARRAARNAEAATAFKPKGVDPKILAAAEAVGAPRQTWDEDYRERLAGTIESSDDEDDAIVVLPPPAIKLDPVASRVAWRKAQREAARAQAAELVRERFPAPAAISQPRMETGPVEEVENEEQLLVEEEVPEEEMITGEENGEEEEIADEQVADISDEENDSEAKMDIEPPVEDAEAQESVDMNAETQPPAHSLSRTASFDANAETQPPEDNECNTSAFALELVHDLISKSLTLSKKPSSLSNSKGAAENDIAPLASPNRTDSQYTLDSSRVTLQTAAESASTAKSMIKILRDTSTCATPGRTSIDEGDGEKEEPKEEITPQKKAITVSSKGGFNFFKKFTLNSEPTSAFIDDEASEDDDDENEEDDAAADSDSGEEEVLVHDVVERDTQETEAEAARLADFHRQWEKGADDEAIRDAAKALVREKDVDDAIDLKELQERQRERAIEEQGQQGNQSENDDAASFCMGRQDELVDDADNYVENMFRDDDSDVEFGEDTQATPEDRKLEARALWMARRKIIQERGAGDRHAISLLTLEGEVDDDENRATVERIRAQFEPKPAAEAPKTRKRKVIDGQTMNWLKRQSARVTVEKKRRSTVTLGKWFQSGPSDITSTPTPTKTMPRVRAKKAAGPPIGGSAVVKLKPRGAAIEVGQFKRRVQAKEVKATPKPRSGLFQMLGALPKTDV